MWYMCSFCGIPINDRYHMSGILCKHVIIEKYLVRKYVNINIYIYIYIYTKYLFMYTYTI